MNAYGRLSPRTLRLGGPLFAFGLFVLADLAGAQVCKRLLPWWEPQHFERSYRIRSPYYHHDLAKSVSVQAHWGSQEYPYRTNALGFRDAVARPVSLQPKGRRVLLLGDSFTEGLGVPYEETFAGILDRAAGVRGVEVLNAAVSSYSPLIYYRKARHYLERVGLRFDAILVCVDISDPYDEVNRYFITPDGQIGTIERPSHPKERAAHWLRYNSIVGRVMTMALLAYEGRSFPPPFGLGQEPARWSHHGETFAAYGGRGLELGGQSMDSLLGLARRHGISLTVLIYPWPDQIIRRDLESSQVHFWRAWAERNDVPLVNLFPLFIGEARPESVLTRYYMPFDQHWTAAGHRLIGDSLLRDSMVGQLLGIDASRFPPESAKEARAQPAIQQLRADQGPNR